MNEFSYIYIFFMLFFLSIAIAIIIYIRDSRKALVQDEDWLSVFIKKKEQQLRTFLPALTIKAYLFLSLLCPVVFTAFFWILMPNKTLASVIGLCTVMLPDFIVQIVIDRRRKRYEENYVRALKALAASLRSGMSIQQSVKELIENPFISNDIREGFRQIDSDITVGISVEEAFHAFAEKADNNDARDIASAISMQNMVGGSEGKTISNIAVNIEERLMTRKKIAAMFSGTDFMIRALQIAPFLVLVMIFLFAPEYYQPVMESDIGTIILIITIAYTVLGSLYLKKQIQVAKGENTSNKTKT